jgi:hypothetical protein
MSVVLADIRLLSIENNIIKRHSKHILIFNWVPAYFTFIFVLIIVAKSKITESSLSFILFSRQVKSKHIFSQKFLVHHFIKNWSHTFFSKLWVSHSYNSFEIFTIENSFLEFNISKFLVFDVNLSV